MSKTRVVVDPITRIEGHLRIEVQAENGRSPTRGPRPPSFAGSRSSCRAATRAMPGRSPSASAASARWCTRWRRAARWRTRSGSRIPPNANLIRNLVHGMQFIQDHVIHFYHLHALDWVDVVSALKADPAGDRRGSPSRSRPGPTTRATYFAEVQNRVQEVRRQRAARHLHQRLLGPPGLQAAARGEPAGGGPLPRGARLAAGRHPAAHHLRRQEPAPQLPGRRHGLGHQPQRHRDDQHRAADRHRDMITRAQQFVEQVYWPDLLAIAGFYKEWGGHRRRGAELPRRRRVPRRRHPRHRQAATSRAASSWARTSPRSIPTTRDQIKEFITSSWYEYSKGDDGGPAPLRWRDQGQVHRAADAVEVPPGLAQVHLDEGAALRRPADAGRAAGADARRLCRRATRRSARW